MFAYNGGKGGWEPEVGWSDADCSGGISPLCGFGETDCDPGGVGTGLGTGLSGDRKQPRQNAPPLRRDAAGAPRAGCAGCPPGPKGIAPDRRGDPRGETAARQPPGEGPLSRLSAYPAICQRMAAERMRRAFPFLLVRKNRGNAVPVI